MYAPPRACFSPHTAQHTTPAGKAVSFEVEVLEVKTRLLPDWDDHFANTVQPGLTIEKIEREVSTCSVVCGVVCMLCCILVLCYILVLGGVVLSCRPREYVHVVVSFYV